MRHSFIIYIMCNMLYVCSPHDQLTFCTCITSVSAQSPMEHTVLSPAARTDAATPSKALLLSMDPERRKKDAGALVLQRLLRGRAAQTRMYEGLQSRIALIRVSSSCFLCTQPCQLVMLSTIM